MAQTPEGTTTAPVQAPDRVPRPMLKLPAGFVFQPKARSLLEDHLIARARDGAIKDPYEDTIADGVDVYAVRPEALPFPRRNRGLHGHVWAYFFATQPAGAEGSGAEDDDDVREVAAGGCWRQYGGDKEYRGRDGEVYAFRRRFAFHQAGPRRKKTVWRMKEFRLKETAPRFRGVVFHPDAKGLVIWKVSNQVIPEEEPAVDYYGNGGMNDDDEEDEDEEIGPVAITVGDAAAAAPDALA